MTEDGSTTVFDEELHQTFHSVHGAVAESKHVFIAAALDYYSSRHNGEINILEAGFGTGLNALLALEWARRKQRRIRYHTVEKFPLDAALSRKLSFWPPLEDDMVSPDDFRALHLARWEEDVLVDESFSLRKIKADIGGMILPDDFYDVVFFDAFSPDKQEALWSIGVFKTLYKSMRYSSVLTTYSVKGDVKRALKAAGFSIEKLPGPKGKREILRAEKVLPA